MVRMVFQHQEGEPSMSSEAKVLRPLAEHPRVRRFLRIAEERPDALVRYVVDEATRTVIGYGRTSGNRIGIIPESHWGEG